MVQYKGYFIFGKALIHPNSPDWWRSQGSVIRTPRRGLSLSEASKASPSNPNKPLKLTAWNSVKNGSMKILKPIEEGGKNRDS
jgi:hypothetical protein